ncbi:MAG: IS66 family transposase [Verrucomicrobiia bacterium]
MHVFDALVVRFERLPCGTLCQGRFVHGHIDCGRLSGCSIRRFSIALPPRFSQLPFRQWAGLKILGLNGGASRYRAFVDEAGHPKARGCHACSFKDGPETRYVTVLELPPVGQAIDYALKRWEALTRFVDDGALEIGNNLIENAIRPSALGKKNRLFVGQPEAGERGAVIYTLLGSCRRHGINPFDYLKDLFSRLPAAKITEIKRFTPSQWAKSCQAQSAQAA